MTLTLGTQNRIAGRTAVEALTKSYPLMDTYGRRSTAKMAKSYRLVTGDPLEINRQLTILSAENRREGVAAGAAVQEQKPVLMSSVIAPAGGGKAAVTLFVIIEIET
jgi:hypothetical protein